MDPVETRTPHARQRLEMIEKYLDSGQPQKQFCQDEQIAYSTFQYWLKKYRQAHADAGIDEPSASGFVPVRFAAPLPEGHGQYYSIEYRNGAVLHIHHPIELPQLMRLIQAQVG